MTRQQKRAELRILAKQIRKCKKAGLIGKKEPTIFDKIKGLFGKKKDS